MRTTFRILAAIASIGFCSFTASSQIRQTKLYIDDGLGNFSILEAPSGPGIFTFPAGGGTLLTSGSVVNLQSTTVGTQQTGNINVSGAILGGSNINTTGGALQTNSITRIDNNGAGTLTSLAMNVHTDVSGFYFFDQSGTPDFTVIETANNATVILPFFANAGRIVAVKFNNSTPTNSMTVSTGPFFALIDGNPFGYTLNGYGGAAPSGIILVSDGEFNWFIIGSH